MSSMRTEPTRVENSKRFTGRHRALAVAGAAGVILLGVSAAAPAAYAEDGTDADIPVGGEVVHDSIDEEALGGGEYLIRQDVSSGEVIEVIPADDVEGAARGLFPEE